MISAEFGLTRKLNSLDFMTSNYLKTSVPLDELQKMADFAIGFAKDSVVQRIIAFQATMK